MKDYNFDLTDEQSIQFESLGCDKIYSIKYSEDEKIGYKSITLFSLTNSGIKSFKHLSMYNNYYNTEFDYIFSLIKPFIREHKINNLVNN
jgi:hypothetical protein